MTSFLEIDGALGEGGGQTVRIATSFSIILGRPIRVKNVRGGRRVPGLRPQHAATLRILRDVCGGTLEGGNVGSTEFTFIPGRPSDLPPMDLDLGTAGSIALVLQALVPAVALSKASLDLELKGGTDVPWSPTSDYIGTVVRPCLGRIGINFSYEVSRRGYYPVGGGMARVHVGASSGVEPIDLGARARGESAPIAIVSRAGSLPRRVAERQGSSASAALMRAGLRPSAVSIFAEDSPSPGSSILVSCVGESLYLGADSIGARGKPAERVGLEAATNFARTFESPARVDPNLADMIAPLLCMAHGQSSLVTSHISGHLRTSLQIAREFTRASYSLTPLERGGAQIRIEPSQQNS